MLASIENYYERLVIKSIQELMNAGDWSADRGDLDDLACIALNYLPPRYVRHSIDLASHLSDAEQRSMEEEAMDAVKFAATIMRRRGDGREHDAT